MPDWMTLYALPVVLLCCSASLALLAFGSVVYAALRLGAQADEASEKLERGNTQSSYRFKE